VLVLPALIVRFCRGPEAAPAPAPTATGPWVRLLVDPDGTVLRLELEEYVRGVVAAEMPAAFELEALKAQAVIARTYAVRRMRALGGAGVPGYPEADVRTALDRGGQAWLSREELLHRWGPIQFHLHWARIEEAVAATRGLIVTFGGLPIDPVYHSTCGGRTENSEDVWQEALPYLRSVTCTTCRHSPHAERTTRTLDVEEIVARLGGEPGLRATAAGRPLIQVVQTTATGRARTVQVGDRRFRAADFRLLLGLPSTNFRVELAGSQVRFTLTGYGHAVGLCQYGADGMARQGRSYEEILRHYYSGVDITPLDAF